MSSGQVRSLILAELEKGLPGLTPRWGQFLAEATVVCLACHKHPKGIQMTVKVQTAEAFTTAFDIYWEEDVTQQMLDAWHDNQDFTEFGACGVAILLMLELTPFTVIRKGKRGAGVDYWLGHKDAALPFQDAARLEVSGILEGDDSLVNTRVKQKHAQTKRSAGRLPAYVIVVEFRRPLSQVMQP